MTNETDKSEPKHTSTGAFAFVFFLFAIVSGILAFILGFGLALSWAKADVNKVSILKDYLFLSAGLTTFCTVIWRGLLTDQQVKVQNRQLAQQREQLQQIVRQNNANEDASYAALLMDGTRLLSEEGDSAKRAGIAALSIVIDDPQRRYTIHALDSLGAEWQTRNQDFSDSNYLSRIRNELKRASRKGLKSTISADFSSTNLETEWNAICGYSQQSYTMGRITGNATLMPDEFIEEPGPVLSKLYVICTDKYVWFFGTTIQSEFVSSTDQENVGRFHACTFDRCRIGQIPSDLIEFNRLKNCSFSGAQIRESPLVGKSVESILKDVPLEGCYYDVDNPPWSWDEFSDWHNYLERRKKISDTWHRLDADGNWRPIASE